MKERIEFELLADELSAESNKVLLKTHLFMDHKTASGEDGGGLEIPVIFDLIGQLKSSFGITPDFAPYEKTELTNTLLALNKLEANISELIKEIKAELHLIDSDPDYYSEEEDED